MRIGVPKEIKNHEYRIGLTPAGVRELGEWHRYDFFSHLLIPRERGYRVTLEDGRSARLRFLSYYCPGPEAGCVTFRYRMEVKGAGERASAPSAG